MQNVIVTLDLWNDQNTEVIGQVKLSGWIVGSYVDDYELWLVVELEESYGCVDRISVKKDKLTYL